MGADRSWAGPPEGLIAMGRGNCVATDFALPPRGERLSLIYGERRAKPDGPHTQESLKDSLLTDLLSEHNRVSDVSAF
jgi:hypothetical protein